MSIPKPSSLRDTAKWAYDQVGGPHRGIQLIIEALGHARGDLRMLNYGRTHTHWELAQHALSKRRLTRHLDRYEMNALRLIAEMGTLADNGRKALAASLGPEGAAAIDELTAARIGLAVRNREQQ